MLSGVIIAYVAVLSGIFWTLVIFKLVEIIYDVPTGIMPVLSAVSQGGIGVTQPLQLPREQLVLRCGQLFCGVAEGV